MGCLIIALVIFFLALPWIGKFMEKYIMWVDKKWK